MMGTPFTIWMIAAVAIVSGLTGFWAGRFDYWRKNREMEPAEATGEAAMGPASQTGKSFAEEKKSFHDRSFNEQAMEFQYRAERERKPYASEQDGRQYTKEPETKPYTSDHDRRPYTSEHNHRLPSPDNRRPENGWKEFGREGRRVPLGWAIGSPVSGEASFYYEGGRRGVIITPEEGMLYSPAAGKIIRLYPTGNAFRIRTDCGAELLVRIGLGTDELEGMYYRPRVLQNEIVNKGKPLIEFDLEKIAREGYDTSVRISVEEAQDYRDISVTDAGHVRVGEDLLWVRQ